MRYLAIAMLVLFSTPALAKHHHKHHHHKHHHRIHFDGYGGSRGKIVSHPVGCPRTAFCGCGVSVRVFGHAVRNLFLASNWFHFPRIAAAAGMVAVRNHHVFYIESANGDGTVTAYDPNSGGHQTRIHRMSLAGYRVVNPRG